MEGLPNAGLSGTLASGGSLCHKYTRLARAKQITFPRQKPLDVVGLEALADQRVYGRTIALGSDRLALLSIPRWRYLIGPHGAVAGGGLWATVAVLPWLPEISLYLANVAQLILPPGPILPAREDLSVSVCRSEPVCVHCASSGS